MANISDFVRYLETQERPEFLPRQLDVMGLIRRLAITNPMTAARELPGKLAESRQMLENYEPGQQVSPELMNQFMNLVGGFAPTGVTKVAKWALPSQYDDVTKLPIPKEFGGIKTEDYLFHGGIKGKLDVASKRKDLQGAGEVGGVIPTSFSKSPQEALEYTTIAGGDMVAIPKSSLNLYKGGDDALNNAVMQGDLQALKKAGFDGVDLREIYPGGYREVLVWDLNKVADKALYAPVQSVDGSVGITEPLKSLLD